MNKRVMALDVGRKKIGVAISDVLGISANPWGYIKGEGRKKAIGKIGELIREYDIGKVILGVPKNMDGSLGAQAQYCLDFAEDLRKMLNIEIDFIDERLSSAEAEKLLISAGVSREQRKKVNDKIAASIILQSFLQKNITTL